MRISERAFSRAGQGGQFTAPATRGGRQTCALDESLNRMLRGDVARRPRHGTLGRQRRQSDDGAAAHAAGGPFTGEGCLTRGLLLHDADHLAEAKEGPDVVDIVHLLVCVQ